MGKKNSDKLSMWSLVWLAVGTVIGAGLIGVTGSAIQVTGRSTWLALGIAVIFSLLKFLPCLFVFGTVILPGGQYGMATNLLGNNAGSLMTMSTILSWISRGTTVLAFGQYLNAVIPAIPAWLGAMVCWTILFIFNLNGVKWMSILQNIASPLLLVALALFSVFGIFKINPSYLSISSSEFFTNGAFGFLSAVVLLDYACNGLIGIINLASKVENPKESIPKAGVIAMIIVFIAYILIGIAWVGVLPLDEIAGTTMIPVAQAILPKGLLVFFMVGGPLMALFTTMNSGLLSFAIPVAAGAKAGWLPKIFAKENKNGIPWFCVTLIYIIGLIPTLTGMSISSLTNFVQISFSVATLLLYIAAFNLPKKYPEEWKKSKVHVPNWLFYGVIVINILYQAYVVITSLVNLSALLIVINLVTIILMVGYGVFMIKKGNIQTLKEEE